jgi:DNA polymerase-3 subunit alpha
MDEILAEPSSESPPQPPKLTAEEAAEKYPGPTELVHLHNHSLFSLLDGVAHPSDYFKACVDRKWPAIAITEHGVLNSVPDAYLAAKEHKIKYITGIEFYYNDFEQKRRQLAAKGVKIGELKQKQPDLASRMTRNRHLTVLAKDAIGYGNLLKINKAAWEFGFYYKPRIWFDLLAKHKEGLIILSGCLNGPICHELRNKNFVSKGYVTGAINYAKMFKNVFGDDYYLELQMPGVEGDLEVFRDLCVLSNNLKIKTTIANDCHYLNRKDFYVQKIMMAIDQATTVDDPNLFHVNSDEQYLKTRAELRATFIERGFDKLVPLSAFELACANTLEISDKCSSFKPNLEPKLPKIENADEKLRKLAYDGLVAKGLDKDETEYIYDERSVTYKKQLEIELRRIIEKGFAAYFLITLSLIKASTDRGYPRGPGRGSVGGSLVSFVLGIHDLDPIKWNLSFNRFMSPARGGYMLNVLMP